MVLSLSLDDWLMSNTKHKTQKPNDIWHLSQKDKTLACQRCSPRIWSQSIRPGPGRDCPVPRLWRRRPRRPRPWSRPRTRTRPPPWRMPTSTASETERRQERMFFFRWRSSFASHERCEQSSGWHLRAFQFSNGAILVRAAGVGVLPFCSAPGKQV